MSGLPTGAANSGPPGSGSQGPGQGHSLGEGARTADFWAFLTKDWNGRILEPEVMFRLVLVARGAWRSVLFGSTSGSLPWALVPLLTALNVDRGRLGGEAVALVTLKAFGKLPCFQ